jgi:hypothetical protein
LAGGYPSTSSVLLNGATSANLNALNVTKDAHWCIAVGGDGFSVGYIDALTAVIEYIPTSSSSNSVALDETNYVVFLPVKGVATPQLPAGDFTGNGVKLCGNGVTNLNAAVTGRGTAFYDQTKRLRKPGFAAEQTRPRVASLRPRYQRHDPDVGLTNRGICAPMTMLIVATMISLGALGILAACTNE